MFAQQKPVMDSPRRAARAGEVGQGRFEAPEQTNHKVVVCGIALVLSLVIGMVASLAVAEMRLLRQERGQLRRWGSDWRYQSPTVKLSVHQAHDWSTPSPPSPSHNVFLADLKRWETAPTEGEWADAFAEGDAIALPACSCCGVAYQRTVVVMTFGRTGSTLLVSLLGTLEGFDVRGETEEFLYTQFKQHTRMIARRDAVLQSAAQSEAVDARHPFVGLV